MPRYMVHLSAPVTTSVEVEAESREDAEKAAYSEVHVSLCHQCAQAMNPPDDWTAEDVEQIEP